MRQILFGKVIDFFIKEIEEFTVEQQYKNQLLVLISLILAGLSIVMVVLKISGVYEDQVTIPLLILCIIGLATIKISGRAEGMFIPLILGGTLLTAYNIYITGAIHSFNHKWFTVILVFIYFTMPKRMFSYLLVVVFFQICFYFLTHNDLIPPELGTKEDAFIDNIGYFFALYLFLMTVQKYNDLLHQKIENQTESLLVQKQDLVTKNELLEEKKEELLQSNQELERFAYIASHDLKTPLNNIISFSMLLEEELKEVENPKVHQYFGFIQDGSVKMHQLIIDVLEYSKLSDAEEDQFINLNELIVEIKTSISEYINERNAIIKVNNTLPTIKSNHAKMYLLFKNLIENGIKYNESPTPTVEIDINRDADYCEFVIADNGIGISKEFHLVIFEMFSRLHNNSEYDGTGLGLSLSNKIVEGLGGSISVESETNPNLESIGSKFIVRLHKKHFFKPQYSKVDFFNQ